MLKYFVGLIAVVALGFGVYFGMEKKKGDEVVPNITATSTPSTNLFEVVAIGLEIPWDIAFLENGELLVTERPGTIQRINTEGVKTPIHYESEVVHRGEGGLLGILLHPDFKNNKQIYVYISAPGSTGETTNRVERYRLDGESLTGKELIIKDIPGALYHDGGRMEFGPDGLLYITTGDATRSKIAQDKKSLGGKILRLNADGTPAAGNPFDTRVYSYGHRNPQGLAWDDAGRLWETEHGRSGITSGMDELNLIRSGANYGWPEIEGAETEEGMVTPIRNSGGSVTWAPASLAYLNGSLFFGGLRGEALYEAVLEDERVVEFKEHFKGQFGRIRTVRVGPDAMLYLTTSNRDDRGTVKAGDDKIIRVNPALLND